MLMLNKLSVEMKKGSHIYFNKTKCIYCFVFGLRYGRFVIINGYSFLTSLLYDEKSGHVSIIVKFKSQLFPTVILFDYCFIIFP